MGDMTVIGAHALELLAFVSVVLATTTVAVLGWGPQLRVEVRPAVVPVAVRA